MLLQYSSTGIQDKTGVMDINLQQSAGLSGPVTFGMGVMNALFHCVGTIALSSDWLNMSAIEAKQTGTIRRKNQAGIWSRPVAVGM